MTAGEKFDNLISSLGKDKYNVELIKSAYEFAYNAHGEQLRLSGEPYIIHPIAVATILSELGMDSESIVAGLLHDVVEDTSQKIEDIKVRFGADVALLVDSVTKLGKIALTTREEVQAENLRKMLLAMSQDIRVIIIKLADRLHNMRTIDFMSEQKQRDKALETLEIYAPIAHRLGIRPIKDELEDLAIRHLDPVAYKEISDKLKQNDLIHKNFLEKTKQLIAQKVHEVDPNAQIEARTKSVNGIYRKMYMQAHNFDEIYDIYAIRIIVDNVSDCYNCLGIIHDLFRPLPGRFKDYISTPKPNMYQSLHSTMICKEGIPFEVQIRTWEMHKTAEFGIAAHWKYKEGIKKNDKKMEERLSWIRQMIETQQESDNPEEFLGSIKNEIAYDEVYVFTPKGDVITLPVGSTVIDFAYAIHSEVGNKMTGAKLNGRIVPLDTTIKTGDICDVITSSQKGKGPSRDWLKIVKTGQARSKIKQWYKKERRDENIIEGKNELEREFRRNYIRFDDDDELFDFIQKIADKQNCRNIEDFYAKIGYGGVSVSKLMPGIKDNYLRLKKNGEISSDIAEGITSAPKARKSSSRDGVIVDGIENCPIKFSKCCNPLPGDEIIGFITRGHGVSIHKTDCNNVPKDILNCADKGRWIDVHWDKDIRVDLNSTLSIFAIDRYGLLADITKTINDMRVVIHTINARVLKDGNSIVTLSITVESTDHLKNVINKIKKVEGVVSIERSGL